MNGKHISDHSFDRVQSPQETNTDGSAAARTDLNSRLRPSAAIDESTPPVIDVVQTDTVLMVEDNAEYAKLLSEVLDLAVPRRFHVIVEPCLASGVKRLIHERCDVVLLDLGLPDSHGIQTLLSVAEKAQNVPIIVLTVEDEKMATECLESGAYAYVVKSEVAPKSLSTLLMSAASTDRDGKIYNGQVAIELESPRGVAQTLAFLTQIRREQSFRVVLQSGSQHDTRLIVRLVRPLPLKDSLSEMNGVDTVREAGSSQGDIALKVVLS